MLNLYTRISTQVKRITQHASTPIIPYPETEQDRIHECMKKFQDALIQKTLEYVLHWCDKGVYRNAKKILLKNFKKLTSLKNLF